MKNSDNQLAFPQSGPDMVASGQSLESVQGMTLRDYFAAKALQSLLVSHPDSDCEPYGYAKDAYMLADAMLRVR